MSQYRRLVSMQHMNYRELFVLAVKVTLHFACDLLYMDCTLIFSTIMQYSSLSPFIIPSPYSETNCNNIASALFAHWRQRVICSGGISSMASVFKDDCK